MINGISTAWLAGGSLVYIAIALLLMQASLYVRGRKGDALARVSGGMLILFFVAAAVAMVSAEWGG